MVFKNPQYLLETDWLEAHLSDENLRIFDCTVYIRPHGLESGYQAWSEGHIPGSGFADLTSDLSDGDSQLMLMMPKAEQFAATMSGYGVEDGTRVVLYDTFNSMWAARVWWMLRAFGFDEAAVLNGGWRKWTLEGRPVSAEPPAYPPGSFTARPRPELIAGKEEVLAAIGQDDHCLINALTAKEHKGEVAYYGRPGHIPTSVNVPARAIVDKKTNAYLPVAELQQIFDQAGATGQGRVITYCGAGIAASSDAFILTILGKEDVAVYDGSLLEWAPDSSLPLEVKG